MSVYTYLKKPYRSEETLCLFDEGTITGDFIPVGSAWKYDGSVQNDAS